MRGPSVSKCASMHEALNKGIFTSSSLLQLHTSCLKARGNCKVPALQRLWKDDRAPSNISSQLKCERCRAVWCGRSVEKASVGYRFSWCELPSNNLLSVEFAFCCFFHAKVYEKNVCTRDLQPVTEAGKEHGTVLEIASSFERKRRVGQKSPKECETGRRCFSGRSSHTKRMTRIANGFLKH